MRTRRDNGWLLWLADCGVVCASLPPSLLPFPPCFLAVGIHQGLREAQAGRERAGGRGVRPHQGRTRVPHVRKDRAGRRRALPMVDAMRPTHQLPLSPPRPLISPESPPPSPSIPLSDYSSPYWLSSSTSFSPPPSPPCACSSSSKPFSPPSFASFCASSLPSSTYFSSSSSSLQDFSSFPSPSLYPLPPLNHRSYPPLHPVPHFGVIPSILYAQ